MDWKINFRSGVAADATKLTVTIWVRHSVWGSVELPL
jgi:hypothetical protein